MSWCTPFRRWRGETGQGGGTQRGTHRWEGDGVKGESQAVTRVSYFRGNDRSKWQSNIPSYDVVSLGEVYEGIEVKLKAYGNNVEKLFYVKPGAKPETIKMKVSGGKG